jgi:hypothetical protein
MKISVENPVVGALNSVSHLVATLPKNSYPAKKKLQPSPLKLLYISSLELVRVSGCHKNKQEVDI